MTKKIIILFIFFFSIIGNAQIKKEVNIDKLTSDFIKNLQSQKIDTICVYENYCIGGGIKTYDPNTIDNKDFCMEDFPNDPVFISWIEKGKTYLTKISICFEYSKTLLPTTNFWNVYFSNQNLINKEEVKQFENKPASNNGKLKHIISVDHSCHQTFKILINGEIIKKHFDSFDLEERNNQEININYAHNKNLKSKFIIDALKEVTSATELKINLKR